MARAVPKEEVRRLLEPLSDEASYEDIQYHIYVQQKIDKGSKPRKAVTVSPTTRSSGGSHVGLASKVDEAGLERCGGGGQIDRPGLTTLRSCSAA
jgi:hypothetical protein